MGYNPKNISLRIYDLQIIGAKLVKPNVFEESLSHPFTNWWGMYWAWVYPKTCHPRFYQVLGSGAGRQHWHGNHGVAQVTWTYRDMEVLKAMKGSYMMAWCNFVSWVVSCRIFSVMLIWIFAKKWGWPEVDWAGVAAGFLHNLFCNITCWLSSFTVQGTCQVDLVASNLFHWEARRLSNFPQTFPFLEWTMLYCVAGHTGWTRGDTVTSFMDPGIMEFRTWSVFRYKGGTFRFWLWRCLHAYKPPVSRVLHVRVCQVPIGISASEAAIEMFDANVTPICWPQMIDVI